MATDALQKNEVFLEKILLKSAFFLQIDKNQEVIHKMEFNISMLNHLIIKYLYEQHKEVWITFRKCGKVLLDN